MSLNSLNVLRNSLKSFFKDICLLEKISSNKVLSAEKDKLLNAVTLDSHFLKASNRDSGLLYTDAVSVLIKHLSKNDFLSKSKVIIEPKFFDLKKQSNKDFTFSSLSGFDLLVCPSKEVLKESVIFWKDCSKSDFSFLELEEKRFCLLKNISKQYKKRKLSFSEVEVAKSIIEKNQDFNARLFCLGYSFEPNLDERLFFENIFGRENFVFYFEKFIALNISLDLINEEENIDAQRFEELEEQIFLFDFCFKEADTKNSPIILLSYLRKLLEIFYSRYNHPKFRHLFSEEYYGGLYFASKNIANISLAYLDKVLILEDT